MKKSFQAGCDTLVNKAKALGITPKSNSPTDLATAMQSIYDTAYSSGQTAGASASKVGTAVAANVLTGKTFTNSTSVGISGTMANNGAVSKTFTPTTAAQSYTVPAGYHSGTGKVTVNATPTQEKSSTPTGGGTTTIAPDSGKFLSKVTINTDTCYSNGRTQGRADVTGNPNGYSLYTATQYSTHYTEGYNAGVAVGKVGFGIIAGNIAFDYNSPGYPNELGNRLNLSYTATQTVCIFVAYAAILDEGTLGCLYEGGTEVWKLENCVDTNRMQFGLKIVKLTAGQTCKMTAQCPVQLRDQQNMMLGYVVVG